MGDWEDCRWVGGVTKDDKLARKGRVERWCGYFREDVAETGYCQRRDILLEAVVTMTMVQTHHDEIYLLH